ncbi:hypothetical protein HNY73_007794 [Argiope bruennichi]|uniref:Uncharacterized protein n=1 Tax=Argiope bruennichi TaxID=94029 RepID=A0A8T0FG12_ARGBR|nr:hypothetical protein HNY73_007794 [Argiope bruennichi]
MQGSKKKKVRARTGTEERERSKRLELEFKERKCKCFRPGYIKAKCPTCSPSEQRDRLALNFLTLQAISSLLALLYKHCRLNVRARADTGASKTVAGELLGEPTPYVEHRIDTGNAPGGRVCVTTHQKSNKANQKSAKFTPRRDGPYIVTTQRSLTSYEVADPNNPNVPLGTYHSSALRPCLESHANSQPVHPLRRICRLKKNLTL